jgi:BirA family transcriptional regulator, biotin operon repressor / biotin---[acetyl-CoA-carboxylase] ligase
VPVATTFLARVERYPSVGSTNDVVRGWLRDGTPEVCVAIADEQTAGRGRDGRSWVAPAGAALLSSAGFRPRWLRPEHAWRLSASVACAMAEAAEATADLATGTIGLKWPNDLVTIGADARSIRKLGGVLGESEGLGTDDPRVVVGIGVNADWPGEAFPSDLAPTMTSLREAAGVPIATDRLGDAYLGRLEHWIGELRDGRFDDRTWASRQVTTGRPVRIQTGDGVIEARASAVDAESGALIVDEPDRRARRLVHAGEIVRLRLAPDDGV